MNLKQTLALTLLLIVGSLQASVITIVGFEGPAREPPGNLHERWAGIQINGHLAQLKPFFPYIKALGTTRFEKDFLLSAGLALRLQPADELPDIKICLQSGPGLTDVGPGHTGQHLNWTTDLLIRYKALVLGYSHTSNGSTAHPNSGLDIFLVGLAFNN